MFGWLFGRSDDVVVDDDYDDEPTDWETFDWTAAAWDALQVHAMATGCAAESLDEEPDGPTASLYFCTTCGDELAI